MQDNPLPRPKLIRRARPAFFFNVCHGGRQGWALTRLGGWADRLIGAGAGLFIAPLWTVEGSLAARRNGDPTWLAYSIYAHPNARVVWGATT